LKAIDLSTVILASIFLVACGGGDDGAATVGGGSSGTTSPTVNPNIGIAAGTVPVIYLKGGEIAVITTTSTSTTGVVTSSTSTRRYADLQSDGSYSRTDLSSNPATPAGERKLNSAGALIGFKQFALGSNGETICTYDKPLSSGPKAGLKAGESFTSEAAPETCTGTFPSVRQFQTVFTANGPEKITVPAGTFDSAKYSFKETRTDSSGVRTNEGNTWIDQVTALLIRSDTLSSKFVAAGTAVSQNLATSATVLVARATPGESTLGDIKQQYSGAWELKVAGVINGTCASVIVTTSGAVSGTCALSDPDGPFSATIRGTVSADGVLTISDGTDTLTSSVPAAASGQTEWLSGTDKGTFTWKHK
jgi:hypothetical protein